MEPAGGELVLQAVPRLDRPAGDPRPRRANGRASDTSLPSPELQKERRIAHGPEGPGGRPRIWHCLRDLATSISTRSP